MGTAKNPAGILAATEAYLFAANELWHDATPDASVEATSVAAENFVAEDIIFTVATESLTGGVIDFFCSFYPLGEDSGVAVA